MNIATTIPSKLNEGKSQVDIVFSFDTTGSMKSVIDSVRKNLSQTVERLFRDVPDIRIGLITHGDYCDYPETMRIMHPTKDVEALKDFIKVAPNTAGGDYDECYELVLKTALDMKWHADIKVLVVIGDAYPHEKGYTLPPNVSEFGIDLDIDWKEECNKLKEAKITVFSCHALPESNQEAISFYTHIAEVTDGLYFPLNELQAFKDYMIAICMRAIDGAEDIALLKQRQRDLAYQSKLAMDEATKEALKLEGDSIEQVLSESKRRGVFVNSVKKMSTRVRSELGVHSRLDELEEVMNNKSKDEGFLTMMKAMKSIDGYETPTLVATKSVRKTTSFNSPSRDDSIFRTPLKVSRPRSSLE